MVSVPYLAYYSISSGTYLISISISNIGVLEIILYVREYVDQKLILSNQNCSILSIVLPFPKNANTNLFKCFKCNHYYGNRVYTS